MDVILASVKCYYALAYLDYTAILAETPERHIKYVHQVFTLPESAVVTLKHKKCSFCTSTIDYPGHDVRPRRLEIDTADTIRYLQQPRDITKLRSFIGLCNVFTRLVFRVVRMAVPLNRKLQKDHSKELGPLKKNGYMATTTFREILISPPILALPHAERH